MSQFDFNSLLASIFEWTWKTSLSGTVLIGLVVVIQTLFRRILPPRWSYALWLLVVLRLMLPAVPSTSFSIFNLGNGLESHFPLGKRSDAPSHRPGLGKPTPDPSPEGNKHPNAAPLPGRVGGWVHGTDAQMNRPSSPRSEPWAAAPRLEEAVSPGGRSFLGVTQWLWVIGSAGYFLTVLIRHRKLASWVKRQPASADPRLQALVEAGKAALGLKRDVYIIESNVLGTPAIFGFLKPRLLLPKSLLERLNDQELRLVILHELVHVRRRDVLLNWLLIALQSLHWFNPAIWLAFRRLKADRELVCDTVVMAKLAAAERQTYGNTLIKLLAESPALAPSLVPIINHKHEIQRRITMIAQFKPTPRIVSIASAMLLLALGCFTFTGAAEKESSLKSPEKPKGESNPDRQRQMQERGIKVLQDEWDKIDHQVRATQSGVDRMKEELRISDLDEADYGNPNPETLRKMEGMRIEASREYKRVSTLYTYLTNLSRVELRKAVPTASPDVLLQELLGQQAVAEQKLALHLEQHPSDAEHPDVKATRRLLNEINRQIGDRLDGILIGLKARAAAFKEQLDDLRNEVDKAKTIDIDNAIKRRPYFQAKRDLESLQLVRQRLQLRLMQEKVDQSLEGADSNITFSGEPKPR